MNTPNGLNSQILTAADRDAGLCDLGYAPSVVSFVRLRLSA